MTIAWEAAGGGAEKVLFIQGAGVPGAGWKPQLAGLSDRFHCASFDNRGTGKSRRADGAFTIDDWRADALEVLDALGWERAHVVGHSLGGLVAQSLALEARARVASLTLMCTFHRGAEASRLSPWIVWTGLRTYVGTRSMRRRAFLEILLSPAERAARASALDDYAAELAPLFGRDLGDPAAIAMKQLGAAAKHDVRARLAELADVPTLVVSGAHDRLALPAFGRALAAAIPGARFVECDAAHGLPITRADETNRLVAEHVQSARG
ncbi:MAG: alpha/beta fold hydrolase [Labilithrix sp.]|nr:alpha/beta fold hydrolase [Labilithrix sp.]MCW5814995.1 alpha/beta fold hydrolase [Labilithrix sp.]